MKKQTEQIGHTRILIDGRNCLSSPRECNECFSFPDFFFGGGKGVVANILPLSSWSVVIDVKCQQDI